MRNLIFVFILFCAQINASTHLPIKNISQSTPDHKTQRTLRVQNLSQGDSFYQDAVQHYEKKEFSAAIVLFKKAASLYTLSKDKKHLNQLGKIYTDIAQSYKRLKKRDETVEYYQKALSVFKLIDNKRNIARTYNTLAEAQRYIDKYEIALESSMKSLKLHNVIDDPEGKAKAQIGAAIIYRHIGRYEASLEQAYRAYRYFKSVNNTARIAKAANEMGLIYTKLKQFDQANFFYNQTINLPIEDIDTNTLATALRETAVIELTNKHYQSARELAQQALEVYSKTQEFDKQSVVTRIIANSYRKEKNIEQAIFYYQKSLALAQAIDSDIYRIKTLIPLSDILIKIDINQAISQLETALALSKKTNDKKHQLYIVSTLKKAHKKQAHFAKALSYAEQYIKLKAQIIKQQDKNQLKLVKANLYSQKLEMELIQLKEKAKSDKLALAKKKNEVEIAQKEKTISELKLAKNKYTTLFLSLFLIVSLISVLVIYRSFIASKKLNKELDYLATRDPLTDCFNRRYLFDYLNKNNNLALKKLCCIIMLDIDHFKVINDTYGHSVGDQVLRDIAKIVKNSLTEHHIATRFGGEEFCLLLPDTSVDSALAIAEKIRIKVEKYRINDIKVTCSFGVSTTDDNAKSSSGLIDRADLALFKSKSLGRNTVSQWSADLDS
ncbi:GGDEF domain-containing protein [Pseudoalteromonas sp. MMG010]|uniref:tetratricopeptide repeat-containing diguanylate cyclase n=1 Tax=Pseudoalteromonas sp. MMG010 TaxID=2822685 RepID=UPI001B3A3378|nr:diguanylate cyclase [Pseudoalteromonas sp. MMG010]MBQ4832062.1 GGDEF domain-containing protein [Pseudoalteromonas sp. MMG010]